MQMQQPHSEINNEAVAGWTFSRAKADYLLSSYDTQKIIKP